MAVWGFNSSAHGASAELLEFLSQADALLDILDGLTPDAFTSPSFERWTRDLTTAAVRRTAVQADIQAFTTAVLGRSGIADAIRSGAKRFRDIEGLLKAREPFAKAVRDRADDESLAKAYFDEIANVSWLTHGVGKAIRYSFFVSAAGAAGIALSPLAGALTGAGLTTLDYYVVDALTKGSRCRMFVEGDIRNFVGGQHFQPEL